MPAPAVGREGFSLIEVIIAIVVLALGILAMGASTGYVVTQIRVADLRTERSAAVDRAVERLHTVPFDDLDSRIEAEADTIGAYTIWWTVEDDGNPNLKPVELYAEGPGYRSGDGWLEAVRDTFVVGIVRGRP